MTPRRDHSALARRRRRGITRRISPADLLPPESRYRPRTSGTVSSAASTFFFVFVVALAVLWFTASLWPLFLIVVTFFARAFFQRSSQLAAVQENQRAVNLLNAGRVDEAAHIFEELTRTEVNSSAHPVYVFNRGVAYMIQGRLKRAYSLFNAVRHSRHFTTGQAASYEPLLYVEMATCLALLGWIDEAADHREAAAARLDRDEVARLAFVDAVIALRVRRPEQAVAVARSNWRSAEALLRVPSRKALRLIYAFALETTSGGASAEFRSLVEGVRPCRPGEFDWVGAEWPAFRAFLARHGLSDPPK